ncbi:unnamed protein product [Parascedosporium putredinis]|uniref:Enoyl-CoA hydratase n=1 Tax=Parascedosporium putredinis TaxID=1442378 RepID=A0A9P1GY23_9PEZI|nr:unnamed protein product [Parascedosporium putredinis]CAI7989555.1 unnamed protein product [Parascedosporium putredinis]
MIRKPLPPLVANMAPSTPAKPVAWLPDTKLQPTPSKEYAVYRHRASIKIELTRPNNRNALTAPMVDELQALYERLAQDASVFRIYLTGQGKVFCAGMDLGASGSATSADEKQHTAGLRKFQSLLRAIEGAPQPGWAFPLRHLPVVAREWGVPLFRSATLTAAPLPASRLHASGAIYALAADNAELQGALCAELETTLSACAPGASAVCKELAAVAWRSPGGEEQDETVTRRYMEMMAPSKEAKFGIEQFRKGVRTVDWTKLGEGNGSKL